MPKYYVLLVSIRDGERKVLPVSGDRQASGLFLIIEAIIRNITSIH